MYRVTLMRHTTGAEVSKSHTLLHAARKHVADVLRNARDERYDVWAWRKSELSLPALKTSSGVWSLQSPDEPWNVYALYLERV